MSFFKRALASVGIGNAKVNAHLEKAAYEVGEEVRGIVVIEGGQVDQEIDNIYMYVMTQYEKEVNDRRTYVSGVVGGFQVSEAFLLKAGERKELPFRFSLPYETPITQGRTPVWIETGLDIPSAVDPKDMDRIEVYPNALQMALLDAVKKLGFQIRKVDCEHSYIRRSHPFVQEFEFVPVSGPFRGRLDELEVIFTTGGPEEFEVLLQIDKRARGLFGILEEAAGLDERYVRFRITAADERSGDLATKLQTIIQQNLR